MITNILDDVLYIGQTVSLLQRFAQHIDDPRMNGLTPLGLGHWFYYLPISPPNLNSTEMRLMSLYRFHNGSLPPLNRIGP